MKNNLNIKVCGMKDPANISEVGALDIGLLGFIFYDKSARHAFDLDAIPSVTQKKVGVFVNPDIEEITTKIDQFQLDFIQLHGEESPEFCSKVGQFNVQVIKVFGIYEAFDFENLEPYLAHCDYFLFDTKGLKRGGNGVAFDWSLLQQYTYDKPYLLSGGLSIELVEEIKKLDLPHLIGVDINSRFEEAPGIKNVSLIKEFVHAIQS